MTVEPPSHRSALFAGFALRTAGVAALAAASGWFLAPLWFSGGAAAGQAAVVGCAASWVPSLAGGLLLIAKPPNPQTAAVRALGAMGLRLLVLAGLVALCGFGLGLPLKPLLVWTAIGYVALLAVDTKFALTASGASAARVATQADSAVDEGRRFESE